MQSARLDRGELFLSALNAASLRSSHHSNYCFKWDSDWQTMMDCWPTDLLVLRRVQIVEKSDRCVSKDLCIISSESGPGTGSSSLLHGCGVVQVMCRAEKESEGGSGKRKKLERSPFKKQSTQAGIISTWINLSCIIECVVASPPAVIVSSQKPRRSPLACQISSGALCEDAGWDRFTSNTGPHPFSGSRLHAGRFKTEIRG